MLKKVEKGQPFVPSTRFHNKVADAVNSMNGFQSGAIKSGRGTHEISVTFINTLDEEIPAGAPLVIDSYNAKLDLFTVRKYQKEDTVFGVVKNTVKKNQIGTAVLVGIAQIKVSGEKKKCVIPVEDEFSWEYSEQGFPVLCSVSDGVLILAGNIMSGANIKSNRPFFATYNPETEMIDITGGWVLGNGEYLSAKSDSLGVQNGYICVTAENVKGKYKDPTFKYGTFGLNCIPIAFVSAKDGVVNIINLYVSTAVMIETVPFHGGL